MILDIFIYICEATFSALAIIKSKYRKKFPNNEDDELLFDFLVNKKQADPFNYYLELIIVICGFNK